MTLIGLWAIWMAGLVTVQSINLGFAALCVATALGAEMRAVMWVSALLYVAMAVL